MSALLSSITVLFLQALRRTIERQQQKIAALESAMASQVRMRPPFSNTQSLPFPGFLWTPSP